MFKLLKGGVMSIDNEASPALPTDIKEELSPSADAQENSSSSQEETSPTLQLIKDALKSDNDEKAAEKVEEKEEAGEEIATEPENASEEEPDEISEDEFEVLKKLKPKTATRIEKLLAKSREQDERIAKSEPEAASFRQFAGFLEKNNISENEANQLFDIGALMKSNPAKALEKLTPYYNQLIQVTGNVLDQSLVEKVEQGYITEDAALELSRHRATTRNYEIAEQQKLEAQQRQRQEASTRVVGEIQESIASLEKQWGANDPDYKLISNRVRDRARLTFLDMKAEGTIPQTKEEAVKLMNSIKASVQKEYRSFLPKKPINTVEGGSSGNASPQFKTSRDVIMHALENS